MRSKPQQNQPYQWQAVGSYFRRLHKNCFYVNHSTNLIRKHARKKLAFLAKKPANRIGILIRHMKDDKNIHQLAWVFPIMGWRNNMNLKADTILYFHSETLVTIIILFITWKFWNIKTQMVFNDEKTSYIFQFNIFKC